MTKPNKKSFFTAAIAVALLLLASVLRIPNLFKTFLLAEAQSVAIYPIYIGMIAVWAVSISRRIMQQNILRYLLATAGCMIFWVIARTLKYKIFFYNVEMERILWYCFYIPMLLIPLLGFFTALCMGNDENRQPDRKHLLLCIPAALLIAGILTNDMHQWAFTLLPDIGHYAGKYTHNFLYFIAAGWMMLFAALTILIIGRKSRIPGRTKRIWLPFVMLGIGVVYTALYIIDQSPTGVGFVEMTAMLCFLIASIWESCIQTGMIPSNTRYDVLFHHSELSVQILNKAGQVCYAAAQAKPADVQSLALLKTKGSFQPDENTKLHAVPIRGGTVIWREDISQITKLNRRLSDNRQRLSESNYLMKKEIETKSETLRVKEQSRLYELISQTTKPQLMQIEKCLEAIKSADEAGCRRLLCEINVFAAYIKRRGNLILMAEENKVVSAGELRLCLVESLENLKLCGIKGGVSLSDEADIPAAFAALCYDLFEEAVERNLSALTGIFAALTKKENERCFTVQAKYKASPAPVAWETWEAEGVSSMGCRITSNSETDGLLTVTLSLPEGGGAI